LIRVSAPLWLVLLSLAALVPLIAFTAFSVGSISDRLIQVEESRIQERTQALSANVDREIKGMLTLADAVAASPYLTESKFAEFYDYAKLSLRGRRANILVLDTSLQQLVNTRVPFGTPLPKTSDPEAAQRAIETKQASVSHVFFGKVAQHLVFDVTVPVIIGGVVRYVVIVTAEPERIAELLEEQKLREGWHSAVIDGKGQIIATDHAEQAKLDFKLANVPKDAEQQLVTANIGGETALIFQTRSPLTGWLSTVWVPMQVLQAPINAMWRTLSIASLLAIGASAILAALFSLPFTNLIRQTQQMALRLGSGEKLPAINTFLKEGEEIEDQLIKTNQQLLARHREAEETTQRIERSEKRLRLALSVARLAIIDRPLQPGATISATNGSDVFGLKLDGLPAKKALEQLLAAIHPGDRPRVEESWRKAESSPGPFSYEYRVTKPDGQTVWIEVKGESMAGPDGAPIRILKTDMDITARKQLEQNLRLVTRELAHRAKNLLTVIQGIATQTASENITLQEFLQSFARRIQGLGASHDLLIHSNWTGAQLASLIEAQMRPFGGVDGKRVTANGPEIQLRNDVLQSLGLAFHELGTNAVKHGALSSPRGTVAIVWKIVEGEGGQRLHLVWTERGGPKVREAKRKGFGHVIMVRTLARVVDGEASLQFKPGGVVWSVDAPLAAILAETSDEPIREP
jgi:PAS domain S-box-containing protein